VIDEAFDGDRRAHPLVDQAQHLDGALAAAGKGRDPVADSNGSGSLGGASVDADMAAAARLGRFRSRLVEADRPEPSVHPADIHGAIVARQGPPQETRAARARTKARKEKVSLRARRRNSETLDRLSPRCYELIAGKFNNGKLPSVADDEGSRDEGSHSEGGSHIRSDPWVESGSFAASGQ
jgi:hypothetical protein